ncbi:MAG: DNA mismatch repair protein MutS [Lachnospiraceae bacterium]|nr:DNA mismatch repair protein MutS [Lachnospiraceae bacterium]
MESYTAIFVIAALIVLTAAIMIVRDSNENKRRFLARTQKAWGKLPHIKQSAEEYECISLYFRDCCRDLEGSLVDDITWNDCDFDRIFRQMNATVSSPGEDVLYSWLRTPVTDTGVLSGREKMIRHYAKDEHSRIEVMRILYGIGRIGKMSVYAHIRKLREAGKIGAGKYIVLCILMCLGLAALFINPVAALAIILPVTAANIITYLRQKDETGIYVKSLSCVLSLAEAAERLSACEDECVRGYRDELKELARRLAPMRRGSFLVTSSTNTDTGMGGALVEYLKILFHFDLIKFDQMVASYKGNEDACLRIFEIAGTLDAAIAVASWREYLGKWCEPELLRLEKAFVEVKNMYHPLLLEPVPVSFTGEGGVLVTGSNASGKSTFLKSMAISSILAQSVHTVPAEAYKASFVRTYTSMALRDDIGSGESYFIVEIRSLKRIVDAAAEGGVPVLGIIDEVLRGTNTIERISASSQILKELAGTKALIFAATHDIELSRILEGLYENYHFTEKIEGGDVKFDYQLRKGPAVSRNAIALLEACGYDAAVAKAAREQAERFERTGEWRL